MQEIDQIYDSNPEFEWYRLTKTPYNQLELLVFLHHIQNHLPNRGLILDAGGGPGRYAINLCRLGYDVVLLDLSSGCIETAKAMLAQQSEEIQGRLMDYVVGNVADMSGFPDEMFDGVLCLDPLSCFAEESEREQAISEVVRVAKSGATVALAVRGYLAVLRTIMRVASDNLMDGSLEILQATGNCHVRGVLHHFFRAAEMRRLAERHGLETLLTAGGEGLSAGLPEATNAIAQDPEKWARWKRIVVDTSTDLAIVDVSEHVLYVGKKKSKPD